jgi:uncharacterized protein (DUF1330 family)
MGEYDQAAGPSVMAAGGIPLVAGAPAQVLEGEWHGTRTVILEFASVDAARSWCNSAEYQAVVGQRHGAATSNVIIIPGFEMPTG